MKIYGDKKIKYIALEMIEKVEDETHNPVVKSGAFIGESEKFIVLYEDGKMSAISPDFYDFLSIRIEYEDSQTLVVLTKEKQDQTEAKNFLVKIHEELEKNGFIKNKKIFDKSKFDLSNFSGKKDEANNQNDKPKSYNSYNYTNYNTGNTVNTNSTVNTTNTVNYKSYFFFTREKPDESIIEEMKTKVESLKNGATIKVPDVDFSSILVENDRWSGVIGYY